MPTEDTQAPRRRLLLFVTGNHASSRRARESAALLCKEELRGRYELEVIDILRDYATTQQYTVFATPTLLLVGPPQRRVIGDFSNRAAVVKALGLAGEI